MPWTADFYEDARGNAPVEAFLQSLPKMYRAKLLGLIAKLKEHGPTLPFPYSSQVEGDCASFGRGLERPGFAFCISVTPIRNLSFCMGWSRIRRNCRYGTLKRQGQKWQTMLKGWLGNQNKGTQTQYQKVE
jgi:hypothetical protein